MNTGYGLDPLTVAIVAYVIFTAINMIGVTLSATFELVITIIAVVELLVFAGVALPSFTWTEFSKDALPHGWGGAFFALPFALWFYLAIEGIANIAEEAKNPQRDLSRGFLTAMATLVVLATLTLFGATGVAGWKAILYTNGISGETSDSPLPLAIRHVVGEGHPLFKVLTTVGLLGLIASFHGILLASSRAMMEMGRTRYFPPILGKLHPTRQTPVWALCAGFVVGLIALFTGQTGDIILLAIFGALTLYISSTVALFVLRRREPNLHRPYRTPGYPVVPIVALVLGVVALVAMVVSKPHLAGIYLGMLVVGTGIWFASGGAARAQKRLEAEAAQSEAVPGGKSSSSALPSDGRGGTQ